MMKVLPGPVVLALSIWLAATPGFAQQTAYNWVDAQGVQHFSDQPPPGHKAKRILLSPGGAAGSAPAGKDAAVPVASAPTIGQQPLDKIEAASVNRSCAKARQNLHVLDSGNMLVNSSDPTTATQLSPEQRSVEQKRAQDFIAKFCGGKP